MGEVLVFEVLHIKLVYGFVAGLYKEVLSLIGELDLYGHFIVKVHFYACPPVVVLLVLLVNVCFRARSQDHKDFPF